MEAKHTPGPWHTSDAGNGLIIYGESGWAVADAKVFHSKQTLKEGVANARLIASAPELLKAAQEMVRTELFLPDHPQRQAAYAATRAAINKAIEHEGE